MSSINVQNEKNEDREWKKLITRHLIAWTVLFIFSMWIWSMIKPLLPEKSSQTIVSGKKEIKKENTNNGVTTTQTGQKQPAESTNNNKQPVVVNTTVPIVTTTIPIVVNGERIDNPLLRKEVKRVMIIVNGLNVRAAPNKESAVIGALRKNEIVAVEGYQGEWLYVKVANNRAGFIKADTKYEKPMR